jgi:four helix bundle protein
VRSARVERFEDLVVWQKARDLSIGIYQITNTPLFARDYGLRDQVRRASVSVMSNIAEGFERYSRPEFMQFLSVARGSVAEVRSQLHVAHCLHYIDDAEFESLRDRCVEISRLIGGLRSALKSRCTG